MKTKLIISLFLLIFGYLGYSLADNNRPEYKLPTRWELSKHYKMEANKSLIDALKYMETVSKLECTCYDVIISTNPKGNIQFQIKQKKGDK